MSTSSISPLTQTFTGVSKFATSLQSVLSRAVSIASLPLDSLNAGLNTLDSKQSALQSIETPFLNLQQSITSLQSTIKSSLLDSSVSDASTVTATVSSGALAGSYSIEVDSLGSWSNALSTSGSDVVSDPTTQSISSSSSLNLTVGSSTTTITPSGSSLQSLVTAINTQASDKVQATLVNVGSNTAPDYRLSLRAVNLGSDSIDLTDGTGDLISSSSAGTLATYKVAGSSTSISSNSRTVTLAPGLIVNLKGQSPSGVSTTINVLNNPAPLSAALSSFANAYNSAVDAVSTQHGQNAGPLQGDSLLESLTQTLNRLGTYSNGSPSSSLASYGLSLDQTGHLSVDSTAFNTAANSNFAGLLSVLGGSTSGGFLKTATDLLSGIEDPVHGLIRNEQSSVATAITAQQTRITNEQAVVNTLQTNLTAQIAKADSTIASLESQVSYVTGLFAAYTGNSTNNTNNGLSTL